MNKDNQHNQQYQKFRCIRCKSPIVEKLTNYTEERNGSVVIVKDVPTLVCTNCGEQFFTMHTALGIEQALLSKCTTTAKASVYQFPH